MFDIIINHHKCNPQLLYSYSRTITSANHVQQEASTVSQISSPAIHSGVITGIHAALAAQPKPSFPTPKDPAPLMITEKGEPSTLPKNPQTLTETVSYDNSDDIQEFLAVPPPLPPELLQEIQSFDKSTLQDVKSVEKTDVILTNLQRQLRLLAELGLLDIKESKLKAEFYNYWSYQPPETNKIQINPSTNPQMGIGLLKVNDNMEPFSNMKI